MIKKVLLSVLILVVTVLGWLHIVGKGWLAPHKKGLLNPAPFVLGHFLSLFFQHIFHTFANAG